MSESQSFFEEMEDLGESLKDFRDTMMEQIRTEIEKNE